MSSYEKSLLDFLPFSDSLAHLGPHGGKGVFHKFKYCPKLAKALLPIGHSDKNLSGFGLGFINFG